MENCKFKILLFLANIQRRIVLLLRYFFPFGKISCKSSKDNNHKPFIKFYLMRLLTLISNMFNRVYQYIKPDYSLFQFSTVDTQGERFMIIDKTINISDTWKLNKKNDFDITLPCIVKAEIVLNDKSFDFKKYFWSYRDPNKVFKNTIENIFAINDIDIESTIILISFKKSLTHNYSNGVWFFSSLKRWLIRS